MASSQSDPPVAGAVVDHSDDRSARHIALGLAGLVSLAVVFRFFGGPMAPMQLAVSGLCCLTFLLIGVLDSLPSNLQRGPVLILAMGCVGLVATFFNGGLLAPGIGAFPIVALLASEFLTGRVRKFSLLTLGLVVIAIAALSPPPSSFHESLTFEWLRPVAVAIVCATIFFIAAREKRKRREIEGELSEMAATDSLTGLTNTREFDRILALRISDARRFGRRLSLVSIDVDYFKLYNDTRGHLEGDRCLIELARILQESFRRETDAVARIGGEEFAVLLYSTSREDAAALVESARQRLAAAAIAHPSSPFGTVTFSAGVAELEDESGKNLRLRSDAALFRAKDHGRNRTVGAPRLGGAARKPESPDCPAPSANDAQLPAPGASLEVSEASPEKRARSQGQAATGMIEQARRRDDEARYRATHSRIDCAQDFLARHVALGLSAAVFIGLTIRLTGGEMRARSIAVSLSVALVFLTLGAIDRPRWRSWRGPLLVAGLLAIVLGTAIPAGGVNAPVFVALPVVVLLTVQFLERSTSALVLIGLLVATFLMAFNREALPSPLLSPEETIWLRCWILLISCASIAFIASRNREERKQIEAELMELATTDPLTGLINAREFNQILALRIADAKRLHDPLTVVSVDVDHFKLFNDTLGHLEGDRCLVEIARILEQSFRRESDTVARVGGEEFIVLLYATTMADAFSLVEAAKARLAQAAITHPGSPFEVVTFSAGIAESVDGQLGSIRERSDAALYEAKHAGRNTIVAAPGAGPGAIQETRRRALAEEKRSPTQPAAVGI